MATFYDQLPSAQGGGFFSQLPSQGRAMVFQPSVEDMFRDELANALARADTKRENRKFATDPETGRYPVDAAGNMQLTPDQGFSNQDIARDVFDPLYRAFPMVDPRAQRGALPRVVGSAERGYSAFDPATGDVSEILPGRPGALSDIDKARIRTIESRRRDIQRSIDQLYEGHPDLPVLKDQLQQLEGLLNQMGITNAVPIEQEPPLLPPEEQGASVEPEGPGFFGRVWRGIGTAARLSAPPMTPQFWSNIAGAVGGLAGGQGEAPPPTQTNAPEQSPQFGTETEARNAGFQPGDVVMIFDPNTRRFRPARLN